MQSVVGSPKIKQTTIMIWHICHNTKTTKLFDGSLPNTLIFCFHECRRLYSWTPSAFSF